MAMQASALGLLEDADFSPKQARALAQAIEGEIKGFDLVTVPLLDARNYVTVSELKVQLGEVRVELARLETRLFDQMTALGLTATVLIISAVFFLVLHLKH